MGLIALVCALMWGPGCTPEDLVGEQVTALLHLRHEGATMPILLEGNTASGVVILIVHGGPGGTSRNFNRVAPHFSEPLEERYGVAYWDQRAAGSSRGRASSPPLTVELMVEDLALVVELLRERLGAQTEIFLFAHSFGGYLSGRYLLEPGHQERVSGWINAATVHDYPLNDRLTVELLLEIGRQQIEAGQSVEQWRPIVDFAEGIDPEAIDAETSEQLNAHAWDAHFLAQQDGLTEDDSISLQEGFMRGLWDQSATGQLTALGETTRSGIIAELSDKSLTDRLGEITLPAAFLFGAQDFVTPPGMGEQAYMQVGTPEEDRVLEV